MPYQAIDGRGVKEVAIILQLARERIARLIPQGEGQVVAGGAGVSRDRREVQAGKRELRPGAVLIGKQYLEQGGVAEVALRL